MTLLLCPLSRRAHGVISSWANSRRIVSTSGRRGCTRTCLRSSILSSKSYWHCKIVSGQHRCQIDVREYQWIETKPLMGNRGLDSLWWQCRSHTPNLGQQVVEWAPEETHHLSGYRNENAQLHPRTIVCVQLVFALSLSMGIVHHSAEWIALSLLLI